MCVCSFLYVVLLTVSLQVKLFWFKSEKNRASRLRNTRSRLRLHNVSFGGALDSNDWFAAYLGLFTGVEAFVCIDILCIGIKED